LQINNPAEKMPMSNLPGGVIAAVPTPINDNGKPK
jgi:hypothetical protein